MIGSLLRRPVLLLLGLCLALGAVTAAELTGLSRDGQEVGPPSLPAIPPPAAGPRNGRAGSGAPTSDQQRGWVAATLARPLFAPDRRPRAAAKVVARAAAVLPRLTGVLIYGDSRRALFAGADGAKPMAASEGAEVAGFKIQRIEAGKVTLLGPEGARVVRPASDPRAAAGPGLAGVPIGPESGTDAPAVQRLTAVTGAGRPRNSAR